MGRILLFYLVAICLSQLHSQNLNIARHGKRDNVNNIVSINSKSFYLETIYNDILDSTSLVAINNSGQILFKKTFQLHDYNRARKLLKTNDNCLVLIGNAISCDLPNSSNEKNFIIKLDTNGVIQFQTFSQFFYGYGLDQISDVTQHIDSSYYAVSDSLLYHYSKSGQFVSKINTGLKNINAISALANGNLLISCKQNLIQKNIELNSSAVIINQQNSNNSISKFILSASGDLFALTTNRTIEKYGANLLLLYSSINTISNNYKLTDFIVRNDSLFVVGIESSSNTPVYFILDQMLNLLYQTPINTYKNIYPTGIALTNQNKLNIITQNTSATFINISFNSLYQIPITGNFTSKKDIGVTTFSVTNASFTFDYDPATWPFNFYYPQWPTYNLNVTIKNYTADTIKSFYLNYDGFSVLCGYVIFHKFYATTILPYGNVTVQTGNFYGKPFKVEFTTLHNNDVFYTNVCLFTTVPNSSNDNQIDNDAFCDSIPVTTIITGIKTNLMKESIVTLYPNPFSKSLYFESESNISKIEIYNSLGVLVRETKLNSKTYLLDDPALVNGIYFIRTTDVKSNTQLKKVIKE